MQRQAQFWGTCKDYEAHGAANDSILGYQVEKVLEFVPGNSGDTVLSMVAPALDCYPLKLTITAGENALFDVGSGTTIAPVPIGTVIKRPNRYQGRRGRATGRSV